MENEEYDCYGEDNGRWWHALVFPVVFVAAVAAFFVLL